MFLSIRFIQVIYLERSNLLKLSKVNSRPPCPLESVPNLREWQLGKLEGLKIATLESIYPQQIKAFRSNLAQFDTQMFGAESLYSTTQRTIQFIKSLKDSPAERILIVGHGANLTASLRTLLGYKEPLLRKRMAA